MELYIENVFIRICYYFNLFFFVEYFVRYCCLFGYVMSYEVDRNSIIKQIYFFCFRVVDELIVLI